MARGDNTYCFCQGCGHEHKESDLVKVCIKCLQQKFIPRLHWLEVGFIDKKSEEQWWNHVIEVKTKEILKLIEEKKEENMLRAAWKERSSKE